MQSSLFSNKNSNKRVIKNVGTENNFENNNKVHKHNSSTHNAQFRQAQLATKKPIHFRLGIRTNGSYLTEINSLKGMILRQKNKIIGLTHSVEVKDGDVVNTERRENFLNERIKNLEAELRETKEKLLFDEYCKEKDEEIENQRQTIQAFIDKEAEMENLLEEAKKKNSDLLIMVEASKLSLQKLRAELNAQKELTSAAKFKESKAPAFSGLKNIEIDKYKSELAKNWTELNEKEAKIARLQSKLLAETQLVAEQKSTQGDKIIELENDLEKKVDEIKKLNTEKDILNTKYIQQTESLAEIEEGYKKSCALGQRRVITIVELEKKLKDINLENEKALTNLRSTLSAKESQISNLQERLSQIDEKHKIETDKHESKYLDIEKKLEEMKSAKLSISKSLHNKKSKISELVESIAKIKENHAKQISKTTRDLKQKEKKLEDDHKSVIKSKDSQITKLEKGMTKLTVNYEIINKCLTEQGGKIVDLEGQVKYYKQILDKKSVDKDFVDISKMLSALKRKFTKERVVIVDEDDTDTDRSRPKKPKAA